MARATHSASDGSKIWTQVHLSLKPWCSSPLLSGTQWIPQEDLALCFYLWRCKLSFLTFSRAIIQNTHPPGPPFTDQLPQFLPNQVRLWVDRLSAVLIHCPNLCPSWLLKSTLGLPASSAHVPLESPAQFVSCPYLSRVLPHIPCSSDCFCLFNVLLSIWHTEVVVRDRAQLVGS